MADFGGVIRFTYDGKPLRVRGDFKLEPGDFQYDAEHNDDGSFDRMVKPMGPTIKPTFVDSRDGVSPLSVDWNAVMAGGPYDVSVFEDTNGVIHQITAAKFVGRADIDRKKGLVSGLSIQG